MVQRQYVRLGTAGAADWGDKPVAIVGGGPSLRGFDLGRLKRFTVLAVNASIFDCPWADHGFSLDRRAMRVWWPRLTGEVAMPLTFAVPDPWLVHFSGPPTPNMRFVRRVPGNAMSFDAARIACGGTSGFGAVQLAFLRGARDIRLFGFDYGAGADGQWHHNERHYEFRHVQVRSDWAMWARNFDAVAGHLQARGVSVLNASPGSAITAFRRVTIEEACQ